MYHCADRGACHGVADGDRNGGSHVYSHLRPPDAYAYADAHRDALSHA
jgi:hypothetical protein